MRKTTVKEFAEIVIDVVRSVRLTIKGLKERVYIIDEYFDSWGEAKVMRYNNEGKILDKRFGKLELVDKEIFFISFNTRDT